MKETDADHHWPTNGDDLPVHGAIVPEPRSPAWLVWVGIATFSLLGLLWVWPTDPATSTAAGAAPSGSASSAAP